MGSMQFRDLISRFILTWHMNTKRQEEPRIFYLHKASPIKAAYTGTQRFEDVLSCEGLRWEIAHASLRDLCWECEKEAFMSLHMSLRYQASDRFSLIQLEFQFQMGMEVCVVVLSWSVSQRGSGWNVKTLWRWRREMMRVQFRRWEAIVLTAVCPEDHVPGQDDFTAQIWCEGLSSYPEKLKGTLRDFVNWR